MDHFLGAKEKLYRELENNRIDNHFVFTFIRDPISRFTSHFWEVTWRKMEEKEKNSGRIMFNYSDPVDHIFDGYLETLEKAVLLKLKMPSTGLLFLTLFLILHKLIMLYSQQRTNMFLRLRMHISNIT